MSRNKLYTIILLLCAAGYVWLALSFKYSNAAESKDTGICLFKKVTSLPCPSCGTTRSVISLINGDVVSAIKWNPFGLIVMLFIIIAPIWIVYDLVNKKSAFYRFYKHSELFLRRKYIAIPAIILVLLNWIWNIYKGL